MRPLMVACIDLELRKKYWLIKLYIHYFVIHSLIMLYLPLYLFCFWVQTAQIIWILCTTPMAHNMIMSTLPSKLVLHAAHFIDFHSSCFVKIYFGRWEWRVGGKKWGEGKRGFTFHGIGTCSCSDWTFAILFSWRSNLDIFRHEICKISPPVTIVTRDRVHLIVKDDELKFAWNDHDYRMLFNSGIRIVDCFFLSEAPWMIMKFDI